MGSHRLIFALALCALFTDSQGGSGGGSGDDDDDGSDIFWATVGGYVVMVVLVTGGCGIISLIAFLVCRCHQAALKRRKINNTELAPGECLHQSPSWAQHLIILPEFMNQGFSHKSDGMDYLDTYRVVRYRQGHSCTDGARWDVPLTKGKHLFEIIWPWGQRGDHSTVGVGTAKVSLKVKGEKSLVGNDKESWGLDISKRRVYHKGRIFSGRCPPDGSYVPDRFLMFVDMDEGKLGFGVDVTFWGNVVRDLPTDTNRPLYVMVGTDKYMASISVFYKGSADPGMSYAHGPTQVSPFSMPPPPGPAREPSRPPPYIEVEPKPSTSGGTKVPQTAQIQLPPPPTALYQEPPPYTVGPPKY